MISSTLLFTFEKKKNYLLSLDEYVHKRCTFKLDHPLSPLAISHSPTELLLSADVRLYY